MAIEHLEKESGGVRNTDLASFLGVSKPSVHNMVSTLKKLRLLQSEKFGCIFLTDDGRRSARTYAICYRSIYDKLLAALELPEEQCQNAACFILSQMSQPELAATVGQLE